MGLGHSSNCAQSSNRENKRFNLFNHNLWLYRAFVARLASKGGQLHLTLNEALTWWIAALQFIALDTSASKGDASRQIPKLMVLGMDRDHKLFTEVDIIEDDPENVLDGTWWPIELWND